MNSNLHREIARHREADFRREADLARRSAHVRREVPSILSFTPVLARVEALGFLARRRTERYV
jgi:hypothetical protein